MIHKNAWDWLTGQRLGLVDEVVQYMQEADCDLGEIVATYIAIYQNPEIKTEADKDRVFADAFEGMIENAYDEYITQTEWGE